MARRRWLWWLGGTALLVLSLFIAAKLLLRSRLATGQIEAKLQQLVGGRVVVGQVNVGIRSSSLRDVKFYEQPAAGAPAPKQPWLKAKEVEADASLSSIIAGDTPQFLIVRDATITLRLDKNGKLLTHLPPSRAGKPTEIPSVKVVGGAVTVKQEGRPDFSVTGINLELTSAGSQLTLNGTIDDPNWGQWNANGHYDQTTDTGAGTLKTDRVAVTTAKLRSLPEIAPGVWKQFQLDGDIPLSASLSRRPNDPNLHYRVTTDTRDVRLIIPGADLTVTHVAGGAVVEDGIVTLRDLHGQAAGGELRTSAVLDFTSTSVKLQFDPIVAHGLDVQKLPAKWNVPKQFGGQLVGQARVTVAIGPDGKAQTTGSGTAHLENARFLDQPAEVRLELTAGPHGLKFEQKQSAAEPPTGPAPRPGGALASRERERLERRTAGVSRLVLDAPRANHLASGACRTSRLTPAVRQETSRFASPVARAPGPPGAVALLSNLLLAPSLQPPPAPPAGQPTYVTANLKVRDLDVAELVKRLKVKLPVALAGRLSFAISVSVPINTPRDLKAYRLTGSASSPKLVLEQLELDDVKAEVVYRDGVLTLKDLSAKVPSATATAGPLGGFLGTATLGVEPAGDLNARLTLDRIPLAQVRRLAPQSPEAAGLVSGGVELRIPQGAFGDLTRWAATGNVHAEGLSFAGVGLGALRFNLALAQGQLRLHDIASDLPAGKIIGSVDVPLTEKTAGAADLQLQNVNVAALTRTVPNFPVRLEGRLSGRVQATIPPAQPGQGRAVNADVNLSAPELRVQSIPATGLKGSVKYRDGVATYSLVGKTLGGDFELTGTYPPKPAAAPPNPPGEGRLRINGVRLGALWRALGAQNSLAIRGRVDLNLNYRFAPGQTHPTGTGRLVVSNIGWPSSERTSRIATDVVISANGVRIGELSGNLGDGSVRGALNWDWRLPQRRWFRLTLAGMPSDLLLSSYPDVAENLRGLVDIDARGTLGRRIVGTGEVAVTRARAYSSEVSEIRVPLSFKIDTRRGSGEIALREARATVARGRITGQASLRFGDAVRLDGNLQFFEVDIRTFLSAYTSYGSYSQGRASGRVTFTGIDVHSIDDVTGRLTARLEQTQALQFPILRQIVPFLGGGGAGYVTFNDGKLQANLTRGVLKVQELSLTSRTVKLFISGTVRVATKLLDLNAVAQTGQFGPNLTALRLLGLKIPAIGPIPVGLILQISDFLSNRTMQLHISGTADNPVVRLQPIRLLTQEAVRYFLQRAIPAPAGSP